jgi:hypothetical protein
MLHTLLRKNAPLNDTHFNNNVQPLADFLIRQAEGRKICFETLEQPYGILNMEILL